MFDPKTEERYLELLLAPLDKCAGYQPRFGSSGRSGVSLDQFKVLYREDPFYHWVGLDSELMYAAHKAAGGMTSIYRQLGTGCEQLFRVVVQDAFALTADQVVWSNEIEKKDKTRQTLTLDARIDAAHLKDEGHKQRFLDWLARVGKYLALSSERIGQLRGAVFEARRGYKSADAKRTNADLGFGMNAASENYVPVVAVISTQASQSVLRRYRNKKMLVMTGSLCDDDTMSTFGFFKNVVGFELDKFFERHTVAMRERCNRVLQALLSAEQPSEDPAGTAVSQKKRRRKP